MPRTGPQPRRVRIVRYELPDGTRCSSSTSGAIRVSSLSETYYATLVVDGRKQRFSLGTTDLGAAWIELRRIQRRELERRAGIRDEYLDQAERTFVEHLEDWLASVAASGTEEAGVKLMRARMIHLAYLAGWQRIGDLSAESCMRALAELQRRPKRSSKRDDAQGTSAQTRNHYLSHAKQFSRWLWTSKRLRDHPLNGVRPISVEADRRHDRRSPGDQEIATLLEYLAGSRAPSRRGLSGPARSLAYRLAMATGFRAEEIRSLRRESFDLDAGTVTVAAAYSKRRRCDVQQLPTWLVDELRSWFAGGGGTWEQWPEQSPGRLLVADLRGAGVPYSVPGPDGQPLFFDFHALRHWYCTQIANQPGISPKTLMALTRHSNPSLALKTYAKVVDKSLGEAVAKLPEPGATKAQPKPGSNPK